MREVDIILGKQNSKIKQMSKILKIMQIKEDIFFIKNCILQRSIPENFSDELFVESKEDITMASKKQKNPSKWWEVYPKGTVSGDEECDFFNALSTNPKWQWRSTASIAKESGLSKKRVEEIINKYYKKGMVFQNPANEDQWGYWERVPHMIEDKKSLTEEDRNKRISKAKS